MSTLKGTTMHPRCRHIGASWDLLECWFKLFSTSQNTSRIQFRTFWKKNQIFGFHGVVLVKTFPLMYQLATNVGLILTKLRWFQLFVKSQNSNFELFWKKIKFLGFHAVVLVKTFPLMYQLATNVGLILTKLWWYLFSGCGQTDRQTDRRTDRQTRFWNPHMETCRHTKNFNSKLKISG